MDITFDLFDQVGENQTLGHQLGCPRVQGALGLIPFDVGRQDQHRNMFGPLVFEFRSLAIGEYDDVQKSLKGYQAAGFHYGELTFTDLRSDLEISISTQAIYGTCDDSFGSFIRTGPSLSRLRKSIE